MMIASPVDLNQERHSVIRALLAGDKEGKGNDGRKGRRDIFFSFSLASSEGVVYFMLLYIVFDCFCLCVFATTRSPLVCMWHGDCIVCGRNVDSNVERLTRPYVRSVTLMIMSRSSTNTTRVAVIMRRVISTKILLA